MENQRKTFKDFFKSADDINFSKWKKRSKRKDYGLKKGDGGLPEGGPAGAATAMSECLCMFKSQHAHNHLCPHHVEDEEVNIDDAKNINNTLGDQPEENGEQNELPSDDENMGDMDQQDMEGEEDPDFQGVIRKIDKAHLVYKRKNEDGKFEELWIYKTGDKFEDELDIKQKILSGTDIQPNKSSSENGEQSFEIWTVGNVQFLFITGLDQ